MREGLLWFCLSVLRDIALVGVKINRGFFDFSASHLLAHRVTSTDSRPYIRTLPRNVEVLGKPTQESQGLKVSEKLLSRLVLL
ncbi:MAG: hypothetical protein ACRCSF_11670 [Mycobacteriaceae bacterium]